MSYDPWDLDAPYHARMFGPVAMAERRADVDAMEERRKARHAKEMADEAAFYATNPPPLDRSNVAGLNWYEQMTERGD
jgi:hypothetical protein